LRAFGIYSYHISDPKTFYTKVSGTRDLYRTGDLEGQLRNSIIGRISDSFANSQVPFLDLAANQMKLSQTISEQLNPTFRDLGLAVDSFVVENLSLPEELQKVLDERIEMNMVGDMNRYTKFQVAKSIPIAAANEGGGGIAGIGAGLAAGSAMGQAMGDALAPVSGTRPAGQSGAEPVAATADTKFCQDCGKQIPRPSKFCPECGQAQK
jgi:membrane protease subunit (stomatin/prohibitin family)